MAAWESSTIVEWGGGYGSLARLIRRLSPGDATYALVDAPILCAIAWRYLSDVLGEDAVAGVDEGGLRPGRVNLVPAERASPPPTARGSSRSAPTRRGSAMRCGEAGRESCEAARRHAPGPSPARALSRPA